MNEETRERVNSNTYKCVYPGYHKNSPYAVKKFHEVEFELNSYQEYFFPKIYTEEFWRIHKKTKKSNP